MGFSPAGILYISFIFYLIVSKRHFFAHLVFLCVVTEMFLQMGVIVKIGNYTMEMKNLSEDILILYCIAHINKIPPRLKKGWILLIISYIIPMLLLIFFPSNALVANMSVSWDKILLDGASPVHPIINGEVIKAVFKVILFSFVTLYLFIHWGETEFSWLIKRLSKISTIFMLLGLLEFLIRNILGLNEVWGSFLLFFFGDTESTVYEGHLRGDVYGLNLFTREPAAYSMTLFLVLVIKMAVNRLNGEKRIIDWTIGLGVFLMILSTSMSAYIYVVIFFVLYLLYRWIIKCPKYMKYEKILLFIVLSLVSSSAIYYLGLSDDYVAQRISNIINNLDSFLAVDWDYSSVGDKSSQVRLLSIVQTFVVFLERPIFGYSLFSIVCHGATPQYLAGVGLFGMVCWIRFYYYLIPLRLLMSPQKNAYILCIILYVITVLFGGWLIRPYYDLMLIIYVISCCFLFSNIKKMPKTSN